MNYIRLNFFINIIISIYLFYNNKFQINILIIFLIL